MTVALYDGYCVICNATKRTVTIFDWFDRIEFVDLHDHEEVTRRYPWLDHEEAMGEIHVVDSQTKIHKGYFAVRRMCRDLPLGLPLWLILHIPGMDWIGQRVYRWVARKRYAINRLFGVDATPCEDGTCKIPS